MFSFNCITLSDKDSVIMSQEKLSLEERRHKNWAHYLLSNYLLLSGLSVDIYSSFRMHCELLIIFYKYFKLI